MLKKFFKIFFRRESPRELMTSLRSRAARSMRSYAARIIGHCKMPYFPGQNVMLFAGSFARRPWLSPYALWCDAIAPAQLPRPKRFDSSFQPANL
jgi:hypothetical protein